MALAAVHRHRVAVLARKGDTLVKVRADPGVRLEVAVDHLLRLRAGNLERRGQAVCLLAVHDAKVHGLRAAPQLRGHLLHRHAKHARRRGTVEVRALVERRDQVLVAGKVREQPQLDLRVVAGQKHAVLRHGERRPHAVSQLGPRWDVLQIRVGAREPARRGDGLVQRGVDASVPADELRQRIQVRVLDLRALAVVQHLAHVLARLVAAVRKALDHLRVRGVEPLARLLQALRRQAPHVKQHVAQLLRRVDVEVLPRRCVNLGHHAVDLRAKALGLLAQALRVRVKARALHLQQH